MTAAYGRPFARLKAQLVKDMTPGTPCPGGYCGWKPMFRSPQEAVSFGWPPARGCLDLDHITAVVDGGAGGPVRLTCSRCNRARGQAHTVAVLKWQLASGLRSEWPGRPGLRQAKAKRVAASPRKRERW